jgi:hypothetical protein
MDAKHEEFVKDLIKGKIAEIIFEQMFRESGRHTPRQPALLLIKSYH